MKNPSKPGRIVSLKVAPYAAVSGAGIQWGSLFGYATNDIANGGAGEVEVGPCVTEGKCLGTEAWTEGLKIYWDNTAKQLTAAAAAGANLWVGHAESAKANSAGAVLGRVRLHGASA